MVLFAVIFFWTPPHFWALAIKYEDDYSAASVPMMPVVEGHRATARLMVVYSLVVWALTFVLWLVAPLGWLYLVVAMVLGLLFTGGAVQLARETDPQAQARRAIRYFSFSITHLTLLFLALAVDQLIR